MPFDSPSLHHRSQQGAALLLAIFIIGLAATAYVVHAAAQAATRQALEQQADQTLRHAKDALIGYTLGRTASGERPGNMPRPDYFASSENPANYDGQADSGCLDATKANGLPLKSAGVSMRCLGRLPWRDIGMLSHTGTEHDPLGEMPWYAVSANLVDPTCMSVINPGILRMTYQGYVCEGATLPHPWLTVRDSRGNILSDRVAFILILPGKPQREQQRPVAGNLADVSHYLDTLVVPESCLMPCVPGTYSNADMDNDFIQPGPDQSGSANDRLLYVTIDQLVPLLERRVAQDVRHAINFPSIYAAYGFKYRPWMVSFDNPELWPDHFSWTDLQFVAKGLIPFRICTSNCTDLNRVVRPRIQVKQQVVNASGTLAGVDMQQYLGYFENLDQCTPKSLPKASNSNPNFKCTATITTGLAAGVSSRTVNIDIIGMQKREQFEDATASSHAKRIFLSKQGSYTVLTVADYDAAGTKVGEATLGTVASATTESMLVYQYLYPILPQWYLDNRWYEHMYAALAPAYAPGGSMDCNQGCLSVMQSGNVKANQLAVVVMSAGVALNQTLLQSAPVFSASNPAQVRNSTDLSDYFDSENNVADNLLFDYQWPATSSFNDQVVW